MVCEFLGGEVKFPLERRGVIRSVVGTPPDPIATSLKAHYAKVDAMRRQRSPQGEIFS